ncbi:MAG: RagB/SusD family nutrient uptake outer membrane protein [Segetibacter sp.]
MKKSFIKYSVCFLLIFSSCKKFIDLLPIDQANSENSFKTPADANLAVMGIYDALQSNSYAEDMALLNELISDNARIQPSRQGDAGKGDYRELELFQLTDQNSFFQNRWSASYKGIAGANQLLNKIEQIPFTDAALKNQYIGEAEFLRAVFYFDLVRYFGGVPLSLTQVENTADAFAFKRSTEEEIYQSIISDLSEASKVLPVNYTASNVGRVTQGAAKALLAKVYLTNNKADLALPLLRELTKAPYTYILMPTYAACFDTDNNAESIFEIQYTSIVPIEGNPYPNFFLTNDNTAGRDIYGASYLGVTGQGVCLPTFELFNSYEANDGRRTYTLLKYFSKAEAVDLYVCYKYRGIPTSAYNSEDNITLLRYADVLLMIAEGINEKGKAPTAEAYDALDAVRKRAGLPVVTRNLNYESFKLKLLDERRWEFAFENQRWFDLKRFNKAIDILTAKGYSIKPFHLLYPVPRKEVLISQGNIIQNPGY